MPPIYLLDGIIRVFKKNGFIYDGGPTVITAPYLINELFELFKKNPKDYIKLSPLKIWYQFVFEDKTKFNYSGDENEMKRQIEKISKDDEFENRKRTTHRRHAISLFYFFNRDNFSSADQFFLFIIYDDQLNLF